VVAHETMRNECFSAPFLGGLRRHHSEGLGPRDSDGIYEQAHPSVPRVRAGSTKVDGSGFSRAEQLAGLVSDCESELDRSPQARGAAEDFAASRLLVALQAYDRWGATPRGSRRQSR